MARGYSFDELMAQRENLERVSSKTGRYIVTFFQERRPGKRFHMEDLMEYVRARVPNIAPDSSSRIMRDLRQKGRINYRVVSRRNSLYEILEMK
jgi:hypothetical protein